MDPLRTAKNQHTPDGTTYQGRPPIGARICNICKTYCSNRDDCSPHQDQTVSGEDTQLPATTLVQDTSTQVYLPPTPPLALDAGDQRLAAHPDPCSPHGTGTGTLLQPSATAAQVRVFIEQIFGAGHFLSQEALNEACRIKALEQQTSSPRAAEINPDSNSGSQKTALGLPIPTTGPPRSSSQGNFRHDAEGEPDTDNRQAKDPGIFHETYDPEEGPLSQVCCNRL
jgi:hypothetical protein